MYIKPVAKTVRLHYKMMLMQASLSPFDDKRPTKGITKGGYASDGDDYGSARSRVLEDWDEGEYE